MRTDLVTTLKRQATEILNQLETDREPITITQHGVPSAYLVDVENCLNHSKVDFSIDGCVK